MLNISALYKKYGDLAFDFALEARKRLIGCELSLFLSTDKNSQKESCDIADGVIFHPSHYTVGDDFSKTLGEEMLKFSEEGESTKSFIFIPSYASISDAKMLISDAFNIARTRGKDICFDEKSLLCYFDYNRYSKGVGINSRVIFPSLQKIKAEFALGASLGFLGAAFDISSVCTPYLSLYNAVFSRADYTLT